MSINDLMTNEPVTRRYLCINCSVCGFRGGREFTVYLEHGNWKVERCHFD